MKVCSTEVFFLIILIHSTSVLSELPLPEETVYDVTGVSGKNITLPCPLVPRITGDSPKLILWYKRGVKTPLLSFDTRVSIEQAKGQLSIDPFTAQLTFSSLTVFDDGLYECRVDFNHSPTNTNLINLTVIEAPHSVEIFDKFAGSPTNGILGPYEEGDSVILTCFVHGGTPKPNITWWHGMNLLTHTSPPVEGVRPNIVQSDLFHQKLKRNMHNTTITCSAMNSPLVQPVSSTVTLTMYLLPTSVYITYQKPVNEGMTVKLTCTSGGSRPEADLHWSARNVPLVNKSQVSPGTIKSGSSSTSTLTLLVTKEENRKEVVCEAKNPAIPQRRVSNSTLLIVHYAPSARALLGPSLRPSLLKEGDDVYFVCEVDANPPAQVIKWFHEGKELYQKVSDGVLLSSNSLVLQKVKRHRAGKYTCLASNELGSVKSSPVFLKIKYKPECVTTPTTFYIYDQAINVTCNVSSHPPATKMNWRWNSGSDVMNIRPYSSVLERTSFDMAPDKDGKASGRLTVFPSKNSEDRELSCWAENEMGSQSIPCTFSIKVAQIPAPLTSCRLANITSSSLSLTCDRPPGMPSENTIYRAELYLQNGTLYLNVTSNKPSFNVSSLDPGTSYKIKVYVARGPVTSLPVVVSASTFRQSRVEASTSGASIVSVEASFIVCIIFLQWEIFPLLTPWKPFKLHCNKFVTFYVTFTHLWSKLTEIVQRVL